MKKTNWINLICGLVLFGFAMYGVFYLTNIVDFKTTSIIVNNNQNIWKFLAFVPLLITMLIGAFGVVNGLINMKTMSVIIIILCGGVVGFLYYDLWGFVTIVNKYYEFMNILSYALIATAILLIIDIIIQVITKKRKSKNTISMNIEREL